MAKKKAEPEKKVIADLREGIGWVSFTRHQMLQLKINPENHTTSDLRKAVFKKLGIEARLSKEEKAKIDKRLKRKKK